MSPCFLRTLDNPCKVPKSSCVRRIVNTIEALYERLHEHGYVHNDIALRNVVARRCNDEQDGSSSVLTFRLIDFGKAFRPYRAEASMFKQEMDQGRHMLDKLLNPADRDGSKATQ